MTRNNRRVHFPDEYPSSDTSSSSSSEPFTPLVFNPPPVYVYPASPYYALSPILPVSLEIHGILTTPTFDFNLSVDPTLNPIVYGHSFVARVRNEPATLPAVPSLLLISRFLPWDTVVASSVLPFVTVDDVLGGLYRALRLRVAKGEYQQEGHGRQSAISLAYHRRCSRVLNAEREKQAGVRRVDFLMGSHLFKGLRKTTRPNVWNVVFKPSSL